MLILKKNVNKLVYSLRFCPTNPIRLLEMDHMRIRPMEVDLYHMGRLTYEATQPQPNVNDVTSQTAQTTLVPTAQTASVLIAQFEYVSTGPHDSGITRSALDYMLSAPVPTVEHDVPEVVVYVSPPTLKPFEFLKLVKLLQLLYQNVPLIFWCLCYAKKENQTKNSLEIEVKENNGPQMEKPQGRRN